MQKYKKRYGQHFLHDKNIIKKIIMSIGPRKNDYFLEIGPGEGALTDALLKKTEHVTLIEKDKDLIPSLKSKYCKFRKVKLLNSDILKVNLEDHVFTDTRLIGNLPYNISTEILFRLLPISSRIKDMHFMLQKEVVDRMVAEPGSKTFGRLSIMIQVYFDVLKLFDISPDVFVPKPKIQSSYIRLTPKASQFESNLCENNFKKIVTKAFTARRKMIKTSLKDYLDIEILKTLSINPNARPEVLSVNDFLKMAEHV